MKGDLYEKVKKDYCRFCVICLIINLLVVHASENLHMDTELLEFSNRIPILTLDLGSENGEVGYGGSEQFGYTGPVSFAVEDGAVYILDAQNHRINVYMNGSCTEIAINDFYQPVHMAYDDGKLAVVDNHSDVTIIYASEGNLIKEIIHPEIVGKELVSKIIEIGESYVVWKTFQGNYYRYDWVEGTTTSEQPAIEKSEDSDNEVMIFGGTEKITQRWEVDSQNKIFDVLGVYGDSLVYQQYEYVPNVDMLFTELSVRKINQDGSETYAIVDFSEWKAPALDPFYLSSDGTVYVMECLDEKTVISKLVLKTTDKTHMEELYQLAEARCLEVKAQEERVSVNEAVTTPDHVATRSEVLSRVEEMITLEWTVLPTHKIERSGYENVITIPGYVLAAGDNTVVEGIPYCWGGYHGLAGARYAYSSFESVYELTDKTAGNLYAYSGGLVSGTIGLDCVGFVMSAYDMAGSKLHSSACVNVGTSVSFDNTKPMDILAVDGHVMLYGGMEGSKYITYEALGVEGAFGGGKADKYTHRTLSYFADNGYVVRNLFCSSCNKAGGFSAIQESGHIYVCSECDYEWPEESHDELGGVAVSDGFHAVSCSGCGYMWPDEEAMHNLSGDMAITSLSHARTCSVCDYVWTAYAHNQNGGVVQGTTTHTYICSVCNYGWKSETHTFVNGLCNVCGVQD